jgi:phage gp46-like protein
VADTSPGVTVTDVRLHSSVDGGEINMVAGQLELSDGLETAVYLSLFGGNEEDSGQQDTEALEWWGNCTETEPARKYRSETQFKLRTLPATTGNLRLLEDAAERDLEWLVAAGVAKSVEVVVAMPAVNTVNIHIEVDVGDRRYVVDFRKAWGVKS